MLLDGILAVIIGILLFTNTLMTVASLVLLIGIYWLVKGIIILIGLFSDRSAWGWKLFIGILSMLAGLVVIGSPLLSTILVPTVFAVVIGIWGIVIGIMELIAAFRGEGWGVGVLGVISIIFGVFIAANPVAGALGLVYVTAFFAIFGGIYAIFMAFKMR